MGYVFLALIAMGAQLAVESGLALDFEAPLLVPALAVVPYALAAGARRLSLAGRFGAAGALHAALSWSPPWLHFAALGALGWPRTVERLAGSPPELAGWPDGALLAGFAPFVVFGIAAIDARARLNDAPPQGVARMRSFHVRMFLSGVVPLALYVLAMWALGQVPRLRAYVEHSALGAALFGGALLFLFVLYLPAILSRTWDTETLPAGPARTALEALAARARFRCHDILVWRTGDQMANAAVVGITPAHRVVLLSDALLAALAPRELMAVFGHEVGHVKKHHVLVFLAWAAAFFLGADLLAARLFPEDDLLAAGLLAAVLALGSLLFARLSRRFELDADLYGAEVTGDVQAMVRALERVGGVHGRRQRSWRHFSVAERVEFLLRNALEPRVGRTLRRRLALATVAGCLLAAGALAAEAWRLTRAWPADAVVIELSLGHFARARQLAGRVAELDEDLERRVERAVASGLEGAAEQGAELELLARDALRRGRADAALDYLALADLRGSRFAAPVLEVLEADDPSERAERLADLRARSAAWAQDVERFLLGP